MTKDNLSSETKQCCISYILCLHKVAAFLQQQSINSHHPDMILHMYLEFLHDTVTNCLSAEGFFSVEHFHHL